jgi:hypothetical protein
VNLLRILAGEGREGKGLPYLKPVVAAREKQQLQVKEPVVDRQKEASSRVKQKCGVLILWN